MRCLLLILLSLALPVAAATPQGSCADIPEPGTSGVAGNLLTEGIPSDNEDSPRANRATDIRAAGEALESLLPRVAAEYGIGLSTARDLRGQRVTLFLRSADPDLLTGTLKELLSAGPEAPVLWTRAGKDAWHLEQSARRRDLAKRLQSADLEAFRKRMDEVIDWAKRDGERELEQASDPLRRMSAQARLTIALLVSGLGDAGRERLLAGAPLVIRPGDAPSPLREHLREYLANGSRLQAVPAEELDRYALVFLLARDPADPLGANLIESRVEPGGFLWARHSGALKVPHELHNPLIQDTFRLPPPDPSDTSRRVSLNLTPAPEAMPGAVIGRNLDELLQALSLGSDLNFAADGYLRTRVLFPANLQVRDYPLKQLLDRLTRIWDCNWRFRASDSKTVLVRARGWWLEDQADVPQAQVEELQSGLGPGKSPVLADLLRFAELSKPQAHKLVETGLCPGAYGIVKPMWYDAAGVKPCLQFFNRLPKPQQARAQSKEGLPLREAPELVEMWLGATLAAQVGAVTPHAREDLVFWLLSGSSDPSNPALLPGVEIRIRSADPKGSHWREFLRPSVPRNLKTGAPLTPSPPMAR